MARSRRPALVLLGLALLLLTAAPLWAQAPAAPSGNSLVDAGQPYGRLGRAVITARVAAENLNGGPGAFAVASCMSRLDGGECLISDDDRGFVFRIPGGPPGWQEQGQSPSRETVIRISQDGRAVLKVLYNGGPRPWKGRAKRRSGVWN